MDSHRIDRLINLLSRYYEAISPSTSSQIPSTSFPFPKEISRYSLQAQIVTKLFSGNNEGGEVELELEGASATWRKIFLKRVVKLIEIGIEERKQDGEDVSEEEIHPEILEHLCHYLSVPPASTNQQLTRRYIWGPLEQSSVQALTTSKITTVEDGRQISGGTTGLRTWQASIALANHFIGNPSLCSNHQTVLELGAGVGLTSLVAARISYNTQIISTDVDERVLVQLEQNIKINQLEKRISAVELDWELSTTEEGRIELEEWEKNNGVAQLIIGADIVYDPTLAESLAKLLKFMLRPRQPSISPATALIAATIRNESTWNYFLEACSKNELTVEQIELSSLGDSSIVGTEGWEGEGQVVLVKITV